MGNSKDCTEIESEPEGIRYNIPTLVSGNCIGQYYGCTVQSGMIYLGDGGYKKSATCLTR